MEDRIRAGFEHNERGLFIRMSPQAVEATCQAIAAAAAKLTTAGHAPIVLVSPQIRAALKQLTENHLPQLVVLSFNEVTRDTQVVTLGLASDAVQKRTPDDADDADPTDACTNDRVPSRGIRDIRAYST